MIQKYLYKLKNLQNWEGLTFKLQNISKIETKQIREFTRAKIKTISTIEKNKRSWVKKIHY